MKHTVLALAVVVAAVGQTQAPTFEVAYVVQPPGGLSLTTKVDIMLARSDGTGTRVIASEIMAMVFRGAWSPDGARLILSAFREADEALAKQCRGHFHFSLYVTTLAGGTPERLAELMAPPDVAWSPDSRSVALVSACEDPIRDPKTLDRGYSPATALYVVDVATKSFRRLTGFERFQHPTWSPDGRHITFEGPGSKERESGVYVIDADGRNQRRIADGIVPRWSPKGDLIAYGVPGLVDSDREPSIFVVAPDGTGVRRLATLPSGYEFVWSPDGASLLVPHKTLLLFDVATGTSRDLGSRGLDHAFSPDGRSVVLSRPDAIVSINVSDPRVVTTVVKAPANARFMYSAFVVSPRR